MEKRLHKTKLQKEKLCIMSHNIRLKIFVLNNRGTETESLTKILIKGAKVSPYG